MEAFYIQSGIQQCVETTLQKYKDSIPEKYKKLIDIIYPIVDTVIKQRAEVRYEF